jgi:hypothetical protein
MIKSKNYLMFSFLLILLIIIVIPFSFAEVTIEKVVNPTYNQGDKINVAYKIKNTFNKDITVFLTDTNILNETGFSIECLQFNLPANGDGMLDLSENKIDTGFIASHNGSWNLGTATLYFQNPDLNIIDEADSRPVNIVINKNNRFDANSVKKEINKMNLCNQDQKQQQQQQNQQKQNQPSKEEAQKQRDEQQKQQQEEQQKQQQASQQMQQQYQQQSDLQKKCRLPNKA